MLFVILQFSVSFALLRFNPSFHFVYWRHRYFIYPDGQSFSASLRIEPFAVLFWALGIVLTHILQQVTLKQWYCHGSGKFGSI